MLSLTPLRGVLLALSLLGVIVLVLRADGTPAPKKTEIGFIAVADFSDDRRLAGFAQDLFVGRVTASGQTIDAEPLIQTRYRVQVLKSIKGTAKGAVTVAQYGGHLAATNELRVMEGDRLLEAGKTYLFATRTDADGSLLLVPRFGDVEALDAAHAAELATRFDAANRNAIPFG